MVSSSATSCEDPYFSTSLEFHFSDDRSTTSGQDADGKSSRSIF